MHHTLHWSGHTDHESRIISRNDGLCAIRSIPLYFVELKYCVKLVSEVLFSLREGSLTFTVHYFSRDYLPLISQLLSCTQPWWLVLRSGDREAFSFDIFFDGVRESYMLVPVKHVDLPLYIRTRTSAPHRFPQGRCKPVAWFCLDLDAFLLMLLFFIFYG